MVKAVLVGGPGDGEVYDIRPGVGSDGAQLLYADVAGPRDWVPDDMHPYPTEPIGWKVHRYERRYDLEAQPPGCVAIYQHTGAQA